MRAQRIGRNVALAVAVALAPVVGGCAATGDVPGGPAVTSPAETVTVTQAPTGQSAVDETGAPGAPGMTGSGEAESGEGASSPSTTRTATPAAPADATSTRSPSPKPSCANLTGRGAVRASIGRIPPFDVGDGDVYEWSATDADVKGYDPCAPLSWIVVPIKGATGSSPHQIMLFHHGRFLGTTTKDAYGFWPKVTRLSPSRIAVVYTYAHEDEGTATASGKARSTFTWDAAAGRVVHAGEVPPDVEN